MPPERQQNYKTGDICGEESACTITGPAIESLNLLSRIDWIQGNGQWVFDHFPSVFDHLGMFKGPIPFGCRTEQNPLP